MPTLDPRFSSVLKAVAKAAEEYGEHPSVHRADDILDRLLDIAESAFPGATWRDTAAGIRAALAACSPVSPSRSAEDARIDPQPENL